MHSLILDQISGPAVPLVGDDIDTDRIMPARYLKELTFSNLGKYVFADEIIAAEQKSLIHPFANPKYQQAKFLVANAGFGCGSSREHAPQGIKRWGIDCIIAVSFSEIFFSNCYTIGLPCLQVSTDTAISLQKIITDHPEIMFNLNLSAGTLVVGEQQIAYQLNEGLRKAFITGNWDTTQELLSNSDLIQAKREQLPYLAA